MKTASRAAMAFSALTLATTALTSQANAQTFPSVTPIEAPQQAAKEPGNAVMATQTSKMLTPDDIDKCMDGIVLDLDDMTANSRSTATSNTDDVSCAMKVIVGDDISKPTVMAVAQNKHDLSEQYASGINSEGVIIDMIDDGEKRIESKGDQVSVTVDSSWLQNADFKDEVDGYKKGGATLTSVGTRTTLAFAASQMTLGDVAADEQYDNSRALGYKAIVKLSEAALR